MHYELVRVIDRRRLLNPVQLEHRYRTPDKRPLKSGIYAVTWPTGAEPRRYDANARYFGPFPSWREAATYVRALFAPDVPATGK